MKELFAVAKCIWCIFVFKIVMEVIMFWIRRHPKEAIWYKVDLGAHIFDLYDINEESLPKLRRRLLRKHINLATRYEIELSFLDKLSAYNETHRW